MSARPGSWLAGVFLLGTLVCAPPAGAQPIGRLLLTPAQRVELERLRGLRGGELPAVTAGTGTNPSSVVAGSVPALAPREAASAAGAAAPRPAAAPQRVQGWVLRSDGRSTVWMDGVPYYGFDAQGPVIDGAAKRPVDLLPEGALRIQRRP